MELDQEPELVSESTDPLAVFFALRNALLLCLLFWAAAWLAWSLQ